MNSRLLQNETTITSETAFLMDPRELGERFWARVIAVAHLPEPVPDGLYPGQPLLEGAGQGRM